MQIRYALKPGYAKWREQFDMLLLNPAHGVCLAVSLISVQMVCGS
jgi:hypothetical protein